LTRDASIQNCIQTILEKENRIDVLINNAGYGSYGAVEEVTLDEARRQFEVNLFGLARITQLVLPLMRSKNSGRIVNVSSMGGRIYTPFGAWYHATKHAMEGWSDCLRLEVKEFGIKVVVVQPGIIRTSWVDVSIDYLIQSSGSGAYHQSVHRFAHLLQKLYSHSRSTSPEILGRWIAKAATTDRPRTRYAKGLLAIPAITLRTWFGDRLYDTAFMWVMKKSN
ncbi:MAG TPA: oxidoreductase, partial [Membranihabitans sp.]|nr:oxidoreductase [Membranihabitans sp.]